MAGIPAKCPRCGRVKVWKEEINAFTSGVPIGGVARFRLISIRGIFAHAIKEELGFYKVKYRCKGCGFEEIYELPH